SISVVAGMLAGFTPAMESSRTALSSMVRAGTSSVRSRRLQDLLVAGQVAFTRVLLIAGAMAIRSSIRSLSLDPGYPTDHVIEIDLDSPETAKYPSDRKLLLVRELHKRITNPPGVVAVTSGRVPGQGYRTAAIPRDVETFSTKREQALLQYAYVQPNYFETVGLPLTAGRSFEQQEDMSHSVVLSKSAAKQLW